MQQTQRANSFILVLSTLLLCGLAFTPSSVLQNTIFYQITHFQDIVLDALHFPGVILCFVALRLVCSSHVSALLTLFAIVAVECIQLKLGREASVFDAVVGGLGLLVGYVRYLPLRLGVSLVWLLYFGSLFMLRFDLIHQYPNVGNVNKPGPRAHWESIRMPKGKQSHVLFIKDPYSDNTIIRAIKTQNVYWGARLGFKRSHQQKKAKISKVNLCVKAHVAGELILRLDDRLQPSYQERISHHFPVTTKLKCHSFDISKMTKRLNEKGAGFSLENLRHVAIFASPDSQPSLWFEIHSLEVD